MDEILWNRILEAADVIGKSNGVDVPEALRKVSGDIWERHAQRMTALLQFCDDAEITYPFGEKVLLDELADWMDGEAISYLTPNPSPIGEGSQWKPLEEE